MNGSLKRIYHFCSLKWVKNCEGLRLHVKIEKNQIFLPAFVKMDVYINSGVFSAGRLIKCSNPSK